MELLNQIAQTKADIENMMYNKFLKAYIKVERAFLSAFTDVGKPHPLELVEIVKR